MRQYLSFDIELLDDMLEGENDLSKLTPSVGAFCTDYENIHYYEDDPHMTRGTAQKLVVDMEKKVEEGHTIFTWNGTSFDFQLLGLYSGLVEKCGKLALNAVDGMFLVVAQKGFFLGLDTVLKGANIEGKLHQVTLNDGSVLKEMSGKSAPLLWRNKEFYAVKKYLKYDVTQPLKLAYHLERTETINWIAKSGRPNTLRTKMLTVKDAMKLPEPDTSWMKDPKPRMDFVKWIPEEVLKNEGVI
jgi:hypothetical protein